MKENNELNKNNIKKKDNYYYRKIYKTNIKRARCYN